jgi:hypothetical protein
MERGAMNDAQEPADAGQPHAPVFAPTVAGAVRATHRYQVRIVYTEPEFQRRTPDAPSEYSFTYFDIAADSRVEAIRRAVDDFWETARCSRVGWRRCIERVTVLE